MKRSLIALAVSLAAFAGAIGAGGHGSAARQMTVNDAVVAGEGMPRTLSEFGFFADATAQIPSAGVTPYRLNTPLYSDGADKLRFLYLPPGSQAVADGENLLQLPLGAALIKTFAFGEGADRQLIETRVLLHRADGWLALPYRWNEQQTEARLALAGGRLDVETPAGETISYRIPNKNQCKECHGLNGSVVPIGPKARNLSPEWMDALQSGGWLDAAPELSASLPLWESRANVPAETAARAYLDVNCAHCHRPGATASNSGLDLRWEQTEPHALGIMKRPVAAGRGSADLAFDIVPGAPDESILLHRMRSAEPGVAMPELGKATVDEEGVSAVERWIEELR
ncbi:MAG: SO2930 family diheme c-type cytochrome [Alteripontixanthobacter sp.]